jgi:DNA-binding response OmpR family regulator
MNVLIADDDPVSRRLLQGYLQRWGHEVVAAADGEEAWRLFQQGDFPIVISDWMMPGIDGVELVRRIRSRESRGYAYTILLTARSQKEDVVEGMEAGADDFVAKPFDRDELRVRLREGERIVRLEQTLAEQCRALRDARAELEQVDRDLAERAASATREIELHAAAAASALETVLRELQSQPAGQVAPPAAKESMESAQPAQSGPDGGLANSTLDRLRERCAPLLAQSREAITQIQTAARKLAERRECEEDAGMRDEGHP